MSILYSTTFTTNATPIGGVWTTVTGETSMSSDAATSSAGPSGGGNCSAYVSTITPPNDQYAKVVYNGVSTTQGNGGPQVRVATGAETYYLADFDRSASFIQMFKVVAGTFTPIGSGAAWSFANGDILEIRAVGTTISVWLNGTQKDSVTDSAIASGRFGMFGSGAAMSGGGMHYTSFEGGDFGSTAILSGSSSRSPFGKVGMNLNRPGSQLAFMGSQVVPPSGDGATTHVGGLGARPLGSMPLASEVTTGGGANNTLTAPLGSLTLNGLSATFVQSSSNTLAAPLGSLTLNGLLPTFNQSVTLIAPLGTLSLNGLAATFTQSSGTNLVAPLGTLTLNGLLPTTSFTQGNSLTAPLGSMTLTGLLPTTSFTQGNSVTSPLGTLTLNGLVPTFDQTGPNVMAAPLGQLVLMGLAPTIVQSGSIPPGGGGGTGSGGGGGWRPAGYGKSINLDELDTFQKIKRRMGRGKSLAAAMRDIDAVDPVQLTKPRPSSTIAPLGYDEQAELEELELLFNRLHNASL